MKGILYGVSVGPGDPELITLKAVKTIKSCDVIAVPRASSEHDLTAYSIAKSAIPEIDKCKVIELYMPMTRNKEELELARTNAVNKLIELLRAGKNVAFLTLGDVSIYSTYSYLHKTVQAKGFTVKMVAGVPSFCAAASSLGESLTDAHLPLHIVPASYQGVEQELDYTGTKILMKTGKSFASVKAKLKERGLLRYAKMVQRCGMDGECMYQSLEDVENPSDYFSIIIVKDWEGC